MLSEITILGRVDRAHDTLADRVDRLTRTRLGDTRDRDRWREILSTARFSPPLPLLLAGTKLPNGCYSPDTLISGTVPHAAAAWALAEERIPDLPPGQDLVLEMEIDDGVLRFVAKLRHLTPGQHFDSQNEVRLPSPVGQPPAAVARWFSLASSQVLPDPDGQLTTARLAVDAYVQLGKSANTLRAYRSAVRAWCQWANTHDLPALPARSEDVAAYLADMALRKRKTTTIDLHRAALRYLHHLAQVTVPTAHPLVGATLAGIRREVDDPLPHQKTALTWDKLTEVVDTISGSDLASLRDRAILLLGFAGAFRRSELAALMVKDVNIDEDGMHIRLSRSKGDPKRRGTLIGIPRGVTRNCPVRAYEKWLKAADLNTGAVFRRVWSPPKNKMASSPTLRRPKIGPSPLSDRAIADIIQKWCGVTGLEGDFSGHSLRRGAISTGAKDGYDLLELKRFSRHKSLQIVETYIDEASIKERHPGKSRF